MSWKTKIEETKLRAGRLSFEGEVEFREEFPNLAELLLGCVVSGSTDALPAFKLTLFVREGRLRFSCSSPDYPYWGVGELRDPSKGLAAVEAALVAGELAWKEDAPQKGASRR